MENYRPQLFLRTADITVSLQWPEATPNAAEKMVMPGDNVEMVCDLVHEAAVEVGTRFTLREGGKTSKRSYLVFLTHDPHGHSQSEPVLLQSSSRQLKPIMFHWSTRLIPSVIYARARYKSCYCLPLLIPPSVLCHSPLTKARNITSDTYVHTYITASSNYFRFARNVKLSSPPTSFRGCSTTSVDPIW